MEKKITQETTAKLITTDAYFKVFPLLAKELKGKKKDEDRHNIIFCEEKFTLMAERNILGVDECTFNTDVYSFGKYLRGRDNGGKKLLSREGSCMAVRRVLSKVNLDYLPSKKVNISTTLYELIAQLKSAGVSVEVIKDASKKETGLLKRKLSDIGIVYEAYEEFLKENSFNDQNSIQKLVAEAISSDETLKDADIYIVGYTSWTAQARDIITELLKKAKSVTAILVKGDNEQVFVNRTFKYFGEICDKLGKSVNNEDGNLSAFEKNYKYSEEGKLIVEGLYNPRKCAKKEDSEKKEQKDKVSEKVYFNCYSSPQEEIYSVAEVIKTAVIKENRSYKDFTIAVSDKTYYKDIEKQFKLFGIPYSLDNNKNVLSSPLVTLICSYLDTFIKNKERSTIIAFVKNPLVIDDINLADKFENYILKNNISYSAIEKEFTAYDSQDKKYIGEFNEIRERITNLLSGKYNVKELMQNLNVKEKLEGFGNELIKKGEIELGDVTKRIYSKVCDITDEISLILGDDNINATDYKKIFISGINALEMYAIPQYNNAVFIGGYKECALAQAKYLFAIGLTSSVPAYKDDVALLTDGDIDKINQLTDGSLALFDKYKVEPKIKDINKRAREELVTSLGAFREKLYLSYPKTDTTGKMNSKSEIFSYLDNVFKYNCVNRSEKYLTKEQGAISFAKACSRVLEAKQTMMAEGKEDEEKKISPNYSKYLDEINAYYENCMPVAKTIVDAVNRKSDNAIQRDIGVSVLLNDSTSPTHIESFFTCPFMAFSERSLKLTERKDGSYKANNIGLFIHYLIGCYVKQYEQVNNKETSDELFDRILESAKDKYPEFYQDGESGYISDRIKDETRRYCYGIYQSISKSDFKPMKCKGEEVAFNNTENADYKSLELPESHLKLTGRIDRVDEYGDYFRVIDYKTGLYCDEESALFSGTKVQLFLYSQVINDNKKFVGAYYFPIGEDYSSDGTLSIPYGKGFTLNDENMIKKLDNTSDGYKSEALGLKSDKGKLSEKELECYSKYAVKVSDEGAKLMKKGVIIASPLNDSCKNCLFMAMCGGNKKKRVIGTVKKETIIQAVEKEESIAESVEEKE